jgi:hypothetical protein
MGNGAYAELSSGRGQGIEGRVGPKELESPFPAKNGWSKSGVTCWLARGRWLVGIVKGTGGVNHRRSPRVGQLSLDRYNGMERRQLLVHVLLENTAKN